MRNVIGAILVAAFAINATEVGISSAGLEFTFGGRNTLKLQTVARLWLEANFDNDEVDVPLNLRASARWLRLGSSDLTLNFLSGAYFDAELTDDNDIVKDGGITIVEFEPVIELNRKFRIFANATLASFSFETERLDLGVFPGAPPFRLGLRAEL